MDTNSVPPPHALELSTDIEIHNCDWWSVLGYFLRFPMKFALR